MQTIKVPFIYRFLRFGLIHTLAVCTGYTVYAKTSCAGTEARQDSDFAQAMEHGEQRLRAHSFYKAGEDFMRAQTLAHSPCQTAAAGLALGRLYRQSGKRDKAIQQFDAVLAIDDAPADTRGHAAFLTGHCLREQRHFAGASSAYAQAASILPAGSRLGLAARYYEALALHQAGELELALAAYEELAAMEAYPVLSDMLQPRMQRLRNQLESNDP